MAKSAFDVALSEQDKTPRNLQRFVERMIAFQTEPVRGQLSRDTRAIKQVLTQLSHQYHVQAYPLDQISAHLQEPKQLMVLSAALRLEPKEMTQLYRMAEREYGTEMPDVKMYEEMKERSGRITQGVMVNLRPLPKANGIPACLLADPAGSWKR